MFADNMIYCLNRPYCAEVHAAREVSMICLKRRALAGAAGILGLCSSSIAAHADVTISNKPTQNMSCEAGVCTATAPKAVLNVADLPSMLASGDVAVKTGSIAKDIDIDQPLTWSSTSRL